MKLVSSARWASLLMIACSLAWTTSACIVRADDDSADEDVGIGIPSSDDRGRRVGAPDTSDAEPPRRGSPDDVGSPRRDAGQSKSRDSSDRVERRDAGDTTADTEGGTTRDTGSHSDWPGLLDASNGNASDTRDTSSPPDCKGARIRCNGSCIDPRTNDQHCGGCNRACGNGRNCKKRSCQKLGRIEAVITYTNQARSTPTDCGKYGKKPASPKVTGNAELHKAAQAHAESMAKHNFFAHKDPTDGSTFVVRVRRTNYSGRPVGENIAAGGRAYSARQIVQSWVRSDGHCRNLANPKAREIGVGYAESSSGKYGAYWVQVFGR